MSGVKLNHRALLEVAESSPDGAGGFDLSWRTLGELWAMVEPRSGRLTSGDVSPVSLLSYRVTVRAAPVGQSNRPLPGQRFSVGGRFLAINAVHALDTDSRYLVCHCEEEMTP